MTLELYDRATDGRNDG